MNTLRILFDLAEQKPELSNDFLIEALKKTDKTENEFWKELCKGWQYLTDRVNGIISTQGNYLTDASFNAQMLSQIFYLAGLKNKEIFSKDGLTKEGLRITFNHLANYAKDYRLIWYYYSFEGKSFEISYNSSPLKLYELYKVESERQFKNELKSKKPEQIGEWLNIHLRKFVREGGNKADWVKHTRQFVSQLSIEQQDSFYIWYEENNNDTSNQQLAINKVKENLQGSTNIISDKLEPYKSIFLNETDYEKAISEIANFFLGKSNIKTPIFVKNGNIKNLAFALGEIWRSNTNDIITYEYLCFYKKAFSIFQNQKLDEKHLYGCNLYKYSLSKT